MFHLIRQLEGFIIIGIRQGFLTDCCRYKYKLGHKLTDGSFIWSKEYSFKGSPYPGENSLQRVIIFGDMGKV